MMNYEEIDGLIRFNVDGYGVEVMPTGRGRGTKRYRRTRRASGVSSGKARGMAQQ